MEEISGYVLIIFVGIFAIVFLIYGAFLLLIRDDDSEDPVLQNFKNLIMIP